MGLFGATSPHRMRDGAGRGAQVIYHPPPGDARDRDAGRGWSSPAGAPRQSTRDDVLPAIGNACPRRYAHPMHPGRSIPPATVAALTAALTLGAAAVAPAVEVAPRISDREIVERLARLETGMGGVQDRLGDMQDRLGGIEGQLAQLRGDMEGRFGQVDGRFAQIDARFQQVDDRFQQVDDRFQQVDDRFQHVDSRFDQLEARLDRQFDRMHDLMLGLLAAFSVLTASTIGFAVWDRRSMLRPLEAAVVELGSRAEAERGRVDTIVEALRSFGRSDHRVAEILRRLRLL
jgi:archaellum component FlaC